VEAVLVGIRLRLLSHDGARTLQVRLVACC
jgi:hypothetical protein